MPVSRPRWVECTAVAEAALRRPRTGSLPTVCAGRHALTHADSYLFHHLVRSRKRLLNGNATERMRDEDHRQIGHTHRFRLERCQTLKRLRAECHGDDAAPLKLNRCVDTPRGA